MPRRCYHRRRRRSIFARTSPAGGDAGRGAKGIFSPSLIRTAFNWMSYMESTVKSAGFAETRYSFWNGDRPITPYFGVREEPANPPWSKRCTHPRMLAEPNPSANESAMNEAEVPRSGSTGR